MNNNRKETLNTARYAGIWYLLLAISGIAGFMVFHPQVYVSGDPEKTLANLTEHTSIARIRLLFELTIVLSQALAAVWFYKLFKNIHEWGAWTLGIWGMMNSAAIMISAMSMGIAIEVASLPAMAADDKIVLIQVLASLITNAWGVGSLFFGLWLIPMGYIVVKSDRMPIWLGRVLIIGGIGYVLSTYLKYAGLSGAWLETLIIPATIGEFWMIGYLLIYGIPDSGE